MHVRNAGAGVLDVVGRARWLACDVSNRQPGDEAILGKRLLSRGLPDPLPRETHRRRPPSHPRRHLPRMRRGDQIDGETVVRGLGQ